MNKILKRTTALGVGVGMLGGLALASLSVFASGPLVFTFTTNEETPYTFTTSEDGVLLVADGMRPSQEDPNQEVQHYEFLPPMDGSTNQEINHDDYTTSCESELSCTVTVSNHDRVRFITSGDATFELYVDGNPYDANNSLTASSALEVVAKPEDHFSNFDGTAYVVWACGENDSKICMHKITEIDNETSDTDYRAASTITDMLGHTDREGHPLTFDKFGFYGGIRGTAISEDLENWVKARTGNDEATVVDFDWDGLSEDELHEFVYGINKGDYEARLIENGDCSADMSEEELHGCVDEYFDNNGLSESRGVLLQPVGEPTGNNSYTSYGDRNFRLTIYGERYKALELGNMQNLYYIPNYYDSETFKTAIDISGTTAEAPTTLDAFLLEDKVSLKASALGGLEIASIVALDVPEDAVTVSLREGSYELTFSSNFYDDVVFEITDTDGNTYYVEIVRSVLSANIERDGVYVKLYFDAETSWDDYEVLATYAYRDGSTVQKVMENAGRVPINISDWLDANEGEGGQNLKVATFKIDEEDVDDLVEGIYFNVRKVSDSDEVYAGTLTGSGRGIYVESHRRGGGE